MKPTHTLLLLLASVAWIACSKQTTAQLPKESSANAAQAAAETTSTLPEVVSFNEHIQPILADTCFHCHGPDSSTREPKKEPLRLDRPEFAFAKREDGMEVIKPGDPKNSTMIQYIKETDPDLRMPPPEAHKDITPRQLALLEKWIEQGAKYEEHWSFVAPKKPTPPAVAQQNWVKTPIDQFILARLEQEKLQPNPTESPRRLFRRLSYDLTGLPPSPDALKAFEKAFVQDADKAVSEAADQFLSSTEGAEHFARQWLDAVRYGDTHGIHFDNYRSIWPYRDWVIQAFKDNKPWDQFTIEQLGGDLFPQPTLEQKIATGYARCMPTTGEGGAIEEEYYAIYAGDQVANASALWLGLSTQCAACHDHKFDPIAQKEFYQMTAFFRNTPMSALDGNNAQHPPSIFAPALADRPRMAEIDKQLLVTEQQLAERAKSAKADFDAWEATQIAPAPDVPDPTLVFALPLTESEGPVRGTLFGQPFESNATVQRRAGPNGHALVANAQVLSLGDIGNFKRSDSFSYSTFIYVEGKPNGAVFARMNHAEDYRGWDFWLENGQPSMHIVDNWTNAGTKAVANEALAPGTWHHVAVVCDGSKPSDQLITIYVNGKAAAQTYTARGVGPNIQTSVPLTIGARTGGSNLNNTTLIQDLRIYQRALSAEEVTNLANRAPIQNILAIAPDRRTPEQQQALYQHFLDRHDPKSKELRDRMVSLRQEWEGLKSRGDMTLVMEERRDQQPFAHVLNRGSYSDKGEKVGVGVPKVLHPMTPEMPQNRLGFGMWLVDKKNPLVGRVTMNRLWGYLLGTGIVETVEDFGIMGARPSHPQLLDWLAVEFMDSGWNYRHMAKLIVTSATYRQSSTVSKEKLERDPLNRLLARAPRFRLEAESLRDSILKQAELLAPVVGGPSVKPYQPEGIWEAVAMPESNTRVYQQDSGDKLYRRSMYTLWKRTAPPPSMEILNAPTREIFCVRREISNTPLQAFVTLNDPQFVEGYRQLAQLSMKRTSDANQRLQYIAERILGRELSQEEIATMQETLSISLKHYQAQAADATQLISIGATPADTSIPAAELAAWTVVTSQLFNLDEALTK